MSEQTVATEICNCGHLKEHHKGERGMCNVAWHPRHACKCLEYSAATPPSASDVCAICGHLVTDHGGPGVGCDVHGCWCEASRLAQPPAQADNISGSLLNLLNAAIDYGMQLKPGRVRLMPSECKPHFYRIEAAFTTLLAAKQAAESDARLARTELKQWIKAVSGANGKLTAKQRECEALQLWIDTHGVHEPQCAVWKDTDNACDCGLAARSDAEGVGKDA